MSGYDELDAMIARIRRLGAMPEEIAREAVDDVQRAVRATAAAGTAPDGSKWAPTQSGSAPLQHAADSIKVRALGTVVQVIVSGYHAVHHRGTRRMPKRQIIPDTLTPSISRALIGAAERVFRHTIQGR